MQKSRQDIDDGRLTVYDDSYNMLTEVMLLEGPASLRHLRIWVQSACCDVVVVTSERDTADQSNWILS